ncbi:MAG: thiamine-phosphate kinase [Elusimicrobiota bacterium]
MSKNIPLVKDIGENGLISIIRAKVAGGVRLPVEIGDDAFVAGISKNYSLAVTTDILVENTHFRRDWSSPRDIGYKAIAVNISDLAAMGDCKPRYCLVGLALPGNTPVDFVKKLYTGMNESARKWNAKICGGDTVKSEKDIVISITLIGEIKNGAAITRGGAQVGDYIAVTGTFGDSAGGLFILKNKVKINAASRRYLLKKHCLPEPRLDASRRLAKTGTITGMIDSSDGLAASLRCIGEESCVGARIDLDRVPVSPHLRHLCRTGTPPLISTVLTGGEEYELVFTFPASAAAAVKKALPEATVIGTITAGREIKYYVKEQSYQLPSSEFRHFA